MVAMACWSSYLAYKSMFRCVSSSVDISGYIIGNLTFSAVFCCLVGLVRYSWQSGLGPITTTALLSVGGVLLGVLSYGYACLLLQEDDIVRHLGSALGDLQPLLPWGNVRGGWWGLQTTRISPPRRVQDLPNGWNRISTPQDGAD